MKTEALSPMTAQTDVKTRRARLVGAYRMGLPFAELAIVHGGTAQGVRSTIRKMIERGELEQRPLRRNFYSGRFA